MTYELSKISFLYFIITSIEFPLELSQDVAFCKSVKKLM